MLKLFAEEKLDLVLDVWGILSLVMIGIVLCIFLFLYIMVWKVGELPLSHKIAYGALFIPLSLFLFCAILFQLIPDYSLALVIYFLLVGHLFVVMLSDAAGDYAARRVRVGRVLLYFIGYAIGLVAIGFLFGLVFIFMILFGTVGTMRVDRILGFGIIGSIIFILSLWGLKKEEKYGTEGKAKGTAAFYVNVVFLVFLTQIIVLGVFSVIEFIHFQIYGYYLIINIGIHPNYNVVAGVLYFPIGVPLYILSLRKLLRDKRARKQLESKLKLVG